ncbi:phage protein [Methylobacterium sp. A54F]
MSRLYDRVCNLTVSGGSGGTMDLSDFRIVFSVKGATTQSPSKAVIKVFNLSDSTAQKLPKLSGQVSLTAGYKGESGVIFTGNVRERHIGRANPTDTVVTLYAADGDRAYVNAMTSRTLKAGATSKDVYDACLADMAKFGISRGYVPPILDQQKDPRAMALFGMTRDILRKMALANGCLWKIQNGKLNVVPIGEPLPGDAVVLNSTSGMIGRPVQTEQGIIVRSLLNPRLQINGKVKIDEKSIDRAAFNLDTAGDPKNAEPNLGTIASDGLYKVQAITYLGDTRGEPWWADMICNATGEITKSAANLGLV